MTGSPASHSRTDVTSFEVGVVGEDLLDGHGFGNHADDRGDRDAQTADGRHAAHHVRIDRDWLEGHLVRVAPNAQHFPKVAVDNVDNHRACFGNERCQQPMADSSVQEDPHTVREQRLMRCCGSVARSWHGIPPGQARNGA